MNYNIDKLKTIANYAKMMNVTPAYIYKMITSKKINAVEIDEVKFIDVIKYPKLPTSK